MVPGFVDAHTHVAYGGDRLDEFVARSAGASYEAILAAGGGIYATVAATRAQSLVDQMLTAPVSALTAANWLSSGDQAPN